MIDQKQSQITLQEETMYNIQVQDLKEVVNKYMQREHGSDDIEFLLLKGGYKWLEKGLQTNLENGLTEEDFEQRGQYFGTNWKEQIKVPSFWYFFLQGFEDLLMKILLVAGCVSIILDMITQTDDRAIAWIEGFSIILAVLIVTLVQAFNNWKKEKEFQKLNNKMVSTMTVTVVRNGIQSENLLIGDVMAGDVIFLKQGMEIPGDGILLQGFSITLDESSMTGETRPMNKQTIEKCLSKKIELDSQGIENLSHNSIPSPVILSGTKVVSGTGKMLIINIGKNSAIGKIQEIVTSGEQELTPLQLKLEKIARQIGYFGLFAALAVFCALVIRSLVVGGKEKWIQGAGYYLMEILNAFMMAVTILVVSIPEGLQLAVTLSLAFAVNKMLLDQNLVWRLNSCETMGNANIICSDKTGTLTKNQMEVTNIWNGMDLMIFDDVTGTVISYKDYINDQKQQELFLNSIVFNSTEDPNKILGNPTEMAILKYLQKCGVNVIEYRSKSEKIFEASFSSDWKRMSTVIRLSNGKMFVYMKGASEYIVDLCENWLNFNKKELQQCNAETRQLLLANIQQMAMKALRTIGICYKEIDMKDLDLETKDERGLFNFEINGFTLVCLFGIWDTIREEVPLSIKQCKEAGIQVKMVTGDNKITAWAIAYNVGIINSQNESRALVLEGPEFLRKIGGVICDNCKELPQCECVKNVYELAKPENKGKKIRKDTIQNQKEFDLICTDLVVLAWSWPEDKYALIVGLKERDNVVAATGDGTNDAPALKKADVGFAMGIAGAEIAKEASDVIILDDNFASIVKAIKWGRNIYASIQKFIQFQLTVNIAAVFCTLISALVLNETVFSSVQMLWLNLIMDSLGALALATEPPTDKLLKYKPNKKTDSIITPIMLKHIIGQSLYQIAVIFILIFAGQHFLFDTMRKQQNQPGSVLIVNGFEFFGYDKKWYGDYSMHDTYIFNIFVMMQVFNFLNCRVIKDEINVLYNLKKSYYFIAILLIIIVLQIIFLTFTGPAIWVVKWGLDPLQWLLCIGFGLLGVLWSFILKFIPLEKLFKGIGNQKITQQELKQMSTLNLRKKHDSSYFKKQSLLLQRNSIVTSKQNL